MLPSSPDKKIFLFNLKNRNILGMFAVAVVQKLRDEYTGIDEVVQINLTLTAEAYAV